MISLAGLTMHYGSKMLFEDSSLSFNPGKRYGLVGANGTGKTTLLRLITGEETPGGISLLQSTFLSGVISDGSECFSSETPDALGPRNCGQGSAWSRLQQPTRKLVMICILR